MATTLRHRLPGISWIDVKLGARMLVKHPALTAVSAIGMAVAVGIGAGVFGVIHGMTSSPLPLDEGDRIVAIQNVGALGLEQARSTHLHDLQTWRRDLPEIGELGAYRIVTRNLITNGGGITPAAVVEMTASGFRIARVPPLLGRHLVDADEEDSAPAVAVIGHGVWQERFGGEPNIVGRSIRVGGTSHTIVGVMPPEFAFPINNRVWVPLRLNPARFEFGKAPPIDIFGRLAPGASLAEASIEAELSSGTIAALAVLSVAVLLPSVAGLYAFISLTVVRRHREIGIRLALGARSHRVLGGVLGRATWQLSIGIAVGLALAEAVDRVIAGGEILGGREAVILPAVILLMTAAGMLAAWAPARRGLAIQPSEVPRAE